MCRLYFGDTKKVRRDRPSLHSQGPLTTEVKAERSVLPRRGLRRYPGTPFGAEAGKDAMCELR